jgi:hypothetical protein
VGGARCHSSDLEIYILVLLEDRLWSGLACGPRMAVMPLAMIAVFVAILLVALLKDMVTRRWWRMPQVEYGSAWINSRLAWWSLLSLAAIALAAFVFVVTLTPSLTSIMTNGRTVVETGCDGSKVYKTQIDLADAKISYRHPRQGRGYSQHFLVFSDGRNDIRISLDRQNNYPVLIAIAPDTMREFAQWIADKGWRMPVALARMATD